jgi:hypothetical protein
MVCPPATSEAEARWPRFGLVVVATNSRRDYLDQMIRPLDVLRVLPHYFSFSAFLLLLKLNYSEN